MRTLAREAPCRIASYRYPGVPRGMRVAEVGEEPTFVVVLVHHALSALVLGVDEGVVEFLPRADQSVHFQLLHSPVGAPSQLPTGRPHVGVDERANDG